MNENETKEYEAPEVFELGEAGELTQGKHFGTWPDGMDDLLTFQK